jgi:hypothetical protein
MGPEDNLPPEGAPHRDGFAMSDQRKRGRPSDYSADIAVTICDRLAEGECLRSICASEGMPNKATVFRWLGRHDEFRNRYAWAREAQADDILEEIKEIADDSSRDYVKKTEADGKVLWVEDPENIARCRLRINTLFRIVALMAPKKYGNRVEPR